MEHHLLLHQQRHCNSSSTTSKTHIIHPNNDDVSLQNNGTCSHDILTTRESKRGSGGPNSTWLHDHHQWSLSPLPSWKLYENPFFTNGQFVPKYVPRYLNAPSCRRANSFTPAAKPQFAYKAPVLNSHPGPSHVLAPTFCVIKPHDSDATPFQPASPLPPPHSLSGTVISARKLAASFWEHYGVQKLDQGEDEPCDHQHSSRLQALSNALGRPSIPSTCQIPESLEDTRGKENMAHSQAAATLENVLHRVRSVEESQSRSTAMLNKLRSEMVDVAGRIHELEFSHKLAMREINSLLQRFGEQMAISRRKEQEKARLAFLHLREEMEVERDACRLLKMQNKKLTKDLTHANIAAADACEELDRERKARELLEEVCNELAREIGEDKAEVEHLKQEQKECRERLEKELKMMRMAALWRDDRVRSKLSEAQLELMDNNVEQGMPLHELRSKLEAFVSAVGGTCKGSEEEIQKQAEQAKLLTQALELLELEECRRSQDDAEIVSSAVRDRACPNTCFVEENASSSAENRLYGDEGNFSHGDTGTMNGKEHRLFVNEKKKPRKGRRRMRANGKQRHNGGIRIYDQKNYDLWSTHCGNSAWPSSEDEPDSRELLSLQNRTPYWKGGHALEGDLHAHNLDANANSAVVNRNDELLASSGHGRHTVLKEMRPSVLDAASSGHISTKESCHLEQSLSNNSTGKESQRKHSSSARFEIRTGAGELGCTLEAKVGPSMQYSFSEDDATNYYIGSWPDERREKEGKENVREDKHHVRHPHDHLHILKSTGRGEKSAEDSELDDFCFESLREPANAFNDKLSYKANKEEDGVSTERLEGGFSNCSDDACCGIMANCSQSCKDRKNKLHENAESITILATQELSNVEGSADVGGEETINKMSPWRSASTKPRPCFWPPSPDAFSIFGGAKKRSKAYSPTPVTSIDSEYHMNRNSGLHPHDARRHTSPAREAYHQQHLVCVKSNSLGAQLIKARELETETPAKPSFRFSPLRRATSHG